MEESLYNQGYDLVYRDQPSIEEAALASAKSIYRFRRLRNQRFGCSKIFEDPAWDMILAIFIDQMVGRATSISSACYSSHVAPTTALRWINRLIKEGFLYREDDPFDARRSFLRLTEATRERMIALLTDCVEKGRVEVVADC
ncbi:transcriptional regulator [Sphingomonas sp.]|jgi:hypothetical protein|uniref:transcriptional regulator n=1 Tax=Sphingomonas sp. TaxID=28214 RepID=UPI00260C9242|nr:transcriptional regulator [Sphingomonas sp.]MDF2495332.1 MarR family transcriptional regulator [Sphingomonas sp.]